MRLGLTCWPCRAWQSSRSSSRSSSECRRLRAASEFQNSLGCWPSASFGAACARRRRDGPSNRAVLRRPREADADVHGRARAYFVTMLGIIVVAGVLADLINLPGIVGAFLAGLSVNAAVGSHPAKERMEFFGKALFIPIFFVVTAFLIEPVAFGRAIWTQFWLVAGLIGSLILGKGIAAFLAGRAFGYARVAKLEMW